MRTAYTAAQVRAAEGPLLAALAAAGQPDVLMQRAAYALAAAVVGYLGSAYGRRVRLLVGSGNNGGDALYAGAYLLRRGVRVDAVLVADDAHPGALDAFRGAGGRLRPLGSPPVRVDQAPEVVVDGMVGIGGRGGLRPAALAAVEECAGIPVVAVDVPSGVEVDSGEVTGPHVTAALTVSFGCLKVAHLMDPGARACGSVEVVDLGLSMAAPVAVALQAPDVARLLPGVDDNDHKYSRGVVGVRTGSSAYPGAAVLSVAGAACGLAGMVRYDGTAADVVRLAHPEVVLGAGQVQAWVVGSGGGADTEAALKSSLADGCPVVVDAEALVPFVHHRASWPDAEVVLTPHAGELARMLEVERELIEARPLHYARSAAERFASVVLLKGRRSIVAEPGSVRVAVNTTGVPWLATAGSGDVLAGVIGALAAGGLRPFDAAAVGAWLHGSAGTLASAGRPLVARRVAELLPEAVRHVGL